MREIAGRVDGVVLLDFTAHWRGLSESRRRRLLPDGLHTGPEGHAQLARVVRREWARAKGPR